MDSSSRDVVASRARSGVGLCCRRYLTAESASERDLGGRGLCRHRQEVPFVAVGRDVGKDDKVAAPQLLAENLDRAERDAVAGVDGRRQYVEIRIDRPVADIGPGQPG